MQSIVNAATDGLIYQRKGRGNLAKLQQQPVNQKNIWQIQKINYTSSFTNAAVIDSCTFGDGFYASDGTWDCWGVDSMGLNDDFSMVQLLCYDPFAGMFGGGSSGGFSGDNCYKGADCFDKAFDCLLAVGAVVATFISLATCAETLGATCILALIIHPVAGASTGLKCSAAVTECEKPACLKV